MRRFLKYFLISLTLLIVVYLVFFSSRYPLKYIVHSINVGDSLDSFNDVVVYNNGTQYAKSHGKHYAKDSAYYYGKKWQCVEFIKRYYYDHYNYKFPDGSGHAKDFFNKDLDGGALNKRRGLLQYRNAGNVAPKVGDILVFDGSFGHVAIVTKVEEESLEVIQQNIYMRPRQEFSLKKEKGDYFVGLGDKEPLGWLRLAASSQ